MPTLVPATRSNVLEFLSELKNCRDPASFSARLRQWDFTPTRSTAGLDPASDEYKRVVLEQYKEISGRPGYNPSIDEQDTVLDLASGNNNVVYPFTTHDPILAGSYLVGVGIALRAMQVRPGGTIVEYGIGWGHTTLAMAQLGYKVVAVDIEQKFLELVKMRARTIGVDVATHWGEFGDLPPDVDRIDGALFFECFHHSLNHIEVCASLASKLNPRGRMVFAGEPLFADDWHYPWGLRMDGQSVWAIATHGWMELGFKRSYFEHLLRGNGLALERHHHPDFDAVGEVYVGIKN